MHILIGIMAVVGFGAFVLGVFRKHSKTKAEQDLQLLILQCKDKPGFEYLRKQWP